MTWLTLLIPLIITIRDRLHDSTDDFIEERKKRDLFPLWVMLLCTFTRSLIIAIRYGTTAVGAWQSNSEGNLDSGVFNERLIAKSWIVMHPDVVMKEVEKAMVQIGTSTRFFKFKTLTPIYPTMIDKLTDPHYWDKFKWTHMKSIDQE